MNAKLLKAIRDASDTRLAEIAIEFAAKYPEEFEQLLCSPVQGFTVFQSSGVPFHIDLTPAQISQIKAAGTYPGGKISAIRVTRELTNCSLYCAKALVEQQGWFDA